MTNIEISTSGCTRPRRRRVRLFGPLIGLGLLLASFVPAGIPERVEVDPAKTRVGLARVNLIIEDLEVAEDAIVGRYEIRVPLAPWHNDEGKLRLDVKVPIERIALGGVTLEGSGISTDDGRISPVTCAFGDDGSLAIKVATRKHDLAFDTRYRVVE